MLYATHDEAGLATIKTVELDAILGGRAVQHKELQGHESYKFLSYFKPCIIPLEGGVTSGFKKPEEEKFETQLHVFQGNEIIFVIQVPFSRSSLNHDDVFVLDTKDKIFQFNGANSNIQERAKASEVIQFLKDKYHEGMCDVAIVDDGKLQTESDFGEFWVIFGGFTPISKKVASEDDVIPEKTPNLYSITDGQVNPVVGELSKSIQAASQAAEVEASMLLLEDQTMVARLATCMFNSLKGRPIQGCIFKGKEPPLFVAIFQPVSEGTLPAYGGMSYGYKSYIADKGFNDETYSPDCVALIRISGTSSHNNKTVQVDAVCAY
ncbi:villin 2 [Actinidia rufa]|uniref:Villin 2 n=1 Tax=Actinidia rufa TaxID=165716 RepID=A0A7J0ENW1_9ERIC|nr:villin 2 [Actinidia rufa]